MTNGAEGAAAAPHLQPLDPVGRAAAEHRARMALLNEAARRHEAALRPGRVTQLTERERDAVLLFVSGMSRIEASDRLGVSLETVRTLLRRARQKYRRRGLVADSRGDLRQRAIDDGLLEA